MDPGGRDPKTLTKKELQAELKKRGLPSSANKPDLLAKLLESIAQVGLHLLSCLHLEALLTPCIGCQQSRSLRCSRSHWNSTSPWISGTVSCSEYEPFRFTPKVQALRSRPVPNVQYHRYGCSFEKGWCIGVDSS
jgi:hypothetical protein